MDLTHAFAPGIPHWPGFPDEERTTLYWYGPDVGSMGHGSFAQKFTHLGQWGTHVYGLSTDHYQVELLANLERVPESGALVVVSFPKPKDGSGFPARVFAILP